MEGALNYINQIGLQFSSLRLMLLILFLKMLDKKLERIKWSQCVKKSKFLSVFAKLQWLQHK